MQTSPPLPVVLALASLIEGLFEAVGARFGIFPVRGPLMRFLWKRLFRVQRHFAAIGARFAAGKTLPARPSRPNTARAPRPVRDDETPFRLTRWVNPKFGWLCRVVPGYFGASAFARELRELLTTDPTMTALLAATPATARTLRPLCWMLGVALPGAPCVAAASREPCPEPPAPGAAAAWSVARSEIPPARPEPPPSRAAPPPDPPFPDFSVVLPRAA